MPWVFLSDDAAACVPHGICILCTQTISTQLKETTPIPSIPIVPTPQQYFPTPQQSLPTPQQSSTSVGSARLKACHHCHLAKACCDGGIPCMRCKRIGKECSVRVSNKVRKTNTKPVYVKKDIFPTDACLGGYVKKDILPADACWSIDDFISLCSD